MNHPKHRRYLVLLTFSLASVLFGQMNPPMPLHRSAITPPVIEKTQDWSSETLKREFEAAQEKAKKEPGRHAGWSHGFQDGVYFALDKVDAFITNYVSRAESEPAIVRIMDLADEYRDTNNPYPIPAYK